MAITGSVRGLERQVAESYARAWFLFAITGILWLLLGFMLLSYRVSSLSITVVFIAVVFWMGAVSLFAVASITTGWLQVIAVIAAVSAIVAGVGALVWPGPTILVVSLFVAWYLLIRGIFDVAVSLSNTRVRGWWLLLVAGITSIALGAWAIGNPDRSVLLLVTILGIYAVFHGVAELMSGFELRALRTELETP